MSEGGKIGTFSISGSGFTPGWLLCQSVGYGNPTCTAVFLAKSMKEGK